MDKDLLKMEIECDTDCVECKYYYKCKSPMKMDDLTRDEIINDRVNEYYHSSYAK